MLVLLVSHTHAIEIYTRIYARIYNVLSEYWAHTSNRLRICSE